MPEKCLKGNFLKVLIKKYLKNTYNEKEICIVKNVADRRHFLNNYLLK